MLEKVKIIIKDYEELSRTKLLTKIIKERGE
jgi:hypothetical protein